MVFVCLIETSFVSFYLSLSYYHMKLFIFKRNHFEDSCALVKTVTCVCWKLTIFLTYINLIKKRGRQFQLEIFRHNQHINISDMFNEYHLYQTNSYHGGSCYM